MTVLRDHAIADDLVSSAGRQAERSARIGRRTGGDVARLAAGIDDADHGRRHASLKFNCTIFGGSVSTLPSAGSEETSVAWAHTALAKHRANSSAARLASTRAIGMALRLCDQLEARCRRLAVMSMPMAAWPAEGISIQRLTPARALHHGKYMVSGFRPGSEIAGEGEFIEIVVGELAGAPHHFP